MRKEAAGVGLCVAALIVLRLVAGGYDFDTVWAEDGAVFLVDAREHGVLSLVYVYDYLHVLPRALVLLAGALPLSAFAVFTIVASVAVVGLLATYVYVALRDASASPKWAALPGLTMALAPAARFESLGNLANLQWYLVPAAFVAVAASRQRPVGVLVAVLAGLSSPLAVFALGGALVRGRPRPTPALLGLGAALAVHAVAILWAPHSRLEPPVRVVQVEWRIAEQFLQSAVGPAGGPLVAGALLGLLVTLLGVGLWWRGGRSRAGVVPFVTALALYGTASWISGTTARYAACAAILFAVALAMSAPRPGPLTTFWVASAAIVAALGFSAAQFRVGGPEWRPSAEAAEEACAAGQPAEVAVAPAGWRHGQVRLPC